MKKILLMCIFSVFVFGAAFANVTYTETETVTTWERVSFDRPCGCADARPMPKKKPCPKVAAPVRVKTHTEVIDHYQLYQPVTVYKPVGTEIQRRIVK